MRDDLRGLVAHVVALRARDGGVLLVTERDVEVGFDDVVGGRLLRGERRLFVAVRAHLYPVADGSLAGERAVTRAETRGMAGLDEELAAFVVTAGAGERVAAVDDDVAIVDDVVKADGSRDCHASEQHEEDERPHQ
jgi:hypothetical protein